MVLEAAVRNVLVGVVDRIVPADEWPGASANGVPDFIAKNWEAIRQRRDYVDLAAGLRCLEKEAHTRHGKGFAELSDDLQDALLVDVERGATREAWDVPATKWFALMVSITMEGYYADPGNGGNAGQASWAMVGYRP